MISIGKKYRYKGKSLLHYNQPVEVLKRIKSGHRDLNTIKFLSNGSVMPNVPDTDLR